MLNSNKGKNDGPREFLLFGLKHCGNQDTKEKARHSAPTTKYSKHKSMK